MNTHLQSKIQDKVSHIIFNSGLNHNSMNPEDLERLQSAGKKLKLPKKNLLYAEGEPAKGVYILLEGKIKVWHLNPDGSIQILFIYSPGEIFGHRSILANIRQPLSTSALEDCELLFVEKEDFLNVLDKSTILNQTLIKSIGSEFSVLVNRINIFAQRGIKERLALFLLLLNETYRRPEQSPEEAEITLNRNDLAGYTGTSVENLVRTLKNFKENGYIRTSGKSIFIDDFEALYGLTGI